METETRNRPPRSEDCELTRQFVDLLLAWPADSAALAERCRLLVLDGLAVASAGARETGPVLAAELLREHGSSGPCTLIGRHETALAWDAARINGMAMHVLDYEPMWSPANHALSPLLPALLALAQQRERMGHGPQGAALLRALAIGIEAQGRLRLSSGELEPGQLSLHPPGVVGAIAAALGCAALLGLDPATAVMAVGIAASRTGGLLANVGSHTKALHCGDAAAHGVHATLLAQRGFGANPDALAGPRGWGHAFFGERFDPTALLAPLGRGRALDPGCSWKLFPSQFATHFGITAALDARTRLGAVRARDIQRAQLRVPAMPYIDRPRPATGLEGKFSWQYTAAVALLDGEVTMHSFSDARRHSPDVERLLDRFTVIPDAGIAGSFDRMHVELEVAGADGTTVATRCDAPIGSWKRPIEPARVMHKASELLGATIGAERAREFLDTLNEEASGLEVGKLLDLLQPLDIARTTR